MSLGYGVGDALAVATLAWNVYKMCKESPGVYNTVSTEVSSLHLVLKETEDLIAEESVCHADVGRLEQIALGCKEILDDLQHLLDRYNKLGTKTQWTWDRLRFGSEDIATLRTRLIVHTGMLTAFNIAVARSSQKRMEKKLEKFMAEVRAGLREGSVISMQTVNTVEVMDEDDLWLGLRRELEDVGISPQLLNEKKDFVLAWIKTAIAEGTLEEVSNNDDDLLLPKNSVSPQQKNAMGQTSSPAAVSPGLWTQTPSNLLNSGAEMESKIKTGGTALQVAARYSHEESVKLLMESGVEKDPNHSTDRWAQIRKNAMERARAPANAEDVSSMDERETSEEEETIESRVARIKARVAYLTAEGRHGA